MSFLKPKAAKQSSENVNNPLIKSTYGGMMTQGTGANNFLSSLLTGSGDTGAANAGLQGYYANAGYAPAMRQLSQQITGQGAASGLLRSGATANALQTRGTELNQSFFNNYLQQLAGLSGLGLQAGGLVANTGQKSTGTGGGPSTIGTIASLAGSLASIFGASDRRVKRAIERIGEFADGLGIYQWNYREVFGLPKGRYTGVMADEVAKLRPWALGPLVGGFATVNYGAL
jgi:hypothetical protein